MSIYDFKVKTMDGKMQALSDFKGNIILIVNTASKCGFTPQFKELQELYQKFKEEGFVVLGFPSNQFMSQDPGTNEEIKSFCEMNYGVTFPMFAKIDVNGKEADPLYQYLTKEAPGTLGVKAIKWNFTKFLIDRNGNVVDRYAPSTSPSEIKADIEKLIR
ncbi:glutathione peroxidase [Niallia circulans]|jgi:glutathione peroxidase|uniref:Glutathione peroxidase n=3 Tax=Bacteria TaxID=2 RepID=A0A0J1IPK7_NIACI|nr:glutathione peroxidase [Niallia circulans]KLV27878.1 glutathione peroxidase [Niallia circulans]MCM2983080.1 glutathione peroxidase [Niallia circulans]MED5102691.1 glutathione peroxidase [Niallia circulans]NRG33645.1 glutathione peroxidase [Niallia circulans]PAD87100.1 glutathione peroxidase [Niallia circulans]